MECVSLLGKCRACRIKTQKEFQHHIFTTENLQQIFHEATSLEIHENDGLPGILCDDCHSRLIDAFKFRQMCTSSAQNFLQILAGEIDSDYEEKYHPPDESECFPLQPEDTLLPEEKFNPLESLSDTILAQETNSPQPQTKKTSLKSKKMSQKSNLHKNEDDPLYSPRSTRVKVKYEPDDEIQCKFCCKKYKSKNSLKAHMKYNHWTERGVGQPECLICGKKYKQIRDIKRHMIREHKPVQIRCKACGEDFKTNEELAAHDKEYHDPENPKKFICDQCGREFAARRPLLIHKRHHGIKGNEHANEDTALGQMNSAKNNYIRAKIPCTCALCGKSYSDKNCLRKHLNFVHRKITLAQCKICNKKFTRPDTVRGHMVRKHGATGMQKCGECGKLFSTKEGLMGHMKSWHDPENPREKPTRTVVCEVCGKYLWSKHDLMQHLNSHAGILAFKCKICPRSYSSKHHLKVHMMRHDGIKNHVCTVCGLRKTTINELKMHMNIHTKEKIYSCGMCSKTFLTSGSHSRHVKVVHQGLKAFPCPHCERSFGKKETLKHHIMTHTGEKPHACEVCGKRFIQPTALQTHMKTHQKYR